MRAFLFDLDGTLVDSERENAASVNEVLAPRGRPLTAAESAYVVGHGWREIYAHLQQAQPFDLSFETLKEQAAVAKERLCERNGLRILPGAVEFVRRASQVGPCTIVSGSSRREIAWCIARLELQSSIPWFIGAEDVSAGKPSPEGFLAAASRLGVAPAACTVFEDSAVGIAAARAAKMRCVALAAGNFLAQDQSGADMRAESFMVLGDSLWSWCVGGRGV